MNLEEFIKKVEEIYIGYPRFKKILSQIEFIHKYAHLRAESNCMLITGDTGAGKSTLISKYTKDYPEIETKRKKIVPILQSVIPAPASIKSVVEKFLDDLGDPLYEKGKLKGRLQSKINRLIYYIKECEVSLIILDEFQHFIDRDSQRVLQEVANWLKYLIIETKVPVILFGMPESVRILQRNSQLSRRFSQRVSLESFAFESKDDQNEFRTFLKVVDDRLPFEKSSHLADKKLAYGIHYISDGTMAYVMKLIRNSAIKAFLNNENCITPEILSEVFKDYIQPEKPKKINPFIDNNYNNIIELTKKRNRKNGLSNKMKTKKKREFKVKDL